MSKVVVLGAGLMGTAITTPVADNGHSIHLVGTHLDGDIIEEVHESRIHPRLRTRVADNLVPYTVDRLSDALEGADLLILGVNSLGVEWASRTLGPLLPSNVPILAVTKGLAGDGSRLQILPEQLRDGLPSVLRDRVQICAVGGPSIAGELAERRHTCVVFSGPDQQLLDKLASMFRTPYYHIWTTTDIVGVEVCVALKNVYALSVGLAHGFLERDGMADSGAVMHNVAAGIFAQGLYEMSYMVEAMGGQQQSVYSLPGAGDQYVTSMGGRNGRMGHLLGLGHAYSQAKAQHMPDDTIEGAELTQAIGPTVEAMVSSGDLDPKRIPLLRTMIAIVTQDAPADVHWDDFFAG